MTPVFNFLSKVGPRSQRAEPAPGWGQRQLPSKRRATNQQEAPLASTTSQRSYLQNFSSYFCKARRPKEAQTFPLSAQGGEGVTDTLEKQIVM